MVETRGPENQPRHETRDISVRAILWFGAALVVMVVATFVGMKALVAYYTSRQPVAGAPFSPLAPSGLLPPQPRLQISPAQDLKARRAAEDALLKSYGWVDRQAGIVRIPVDRAIELLAERGLPSRSRMEDRESRIEQANQGPGTKDEGRPAQKQ